QSVGALIGHQVADRQIARGRREAARVGPEYIGKTGARLAGVSDGVATAQHRLATLAQDPFEPSLLRAQAPGKAEARTEVLIVGVVAVTSRPVLDKLRLASRKRAGFEEIARPGDPEQISPAGRRVAVVERGEGQLQFPTQPVVDGQTWPRSPGVLGEK